MTDYVQHIRLGSKAFASRLKQLDIELTERCNNDCLHCCINLPVNDLQARQREMTTAQVKDILRQAADLGCLRVRLTGGEPLLRPDFEELYLFARRLGLMVSLFTNARLITPHLADLFARFSPQEKISVTVYGMHPESYETAAHAPGSFAQFWRGVNLLLERNVPFIVRTALLPPNRAELDQFEAWAKTIPWMTERPSSAMNFELRNRRDNEAKNRVIISMRLSPDETIAILKRNETKYRKDITEFASKFMGPPGEKLFGCGVGCGLNLCIDAYGRVQPCMGLRASELTVSVVGGKDGRKAVSLEKTLDQFSALAELRATNPVYLSRCAVCFLKGLCEQCPAKSWAEHGTLDTPVEYLCDVAHAQARWLGWLGKTEYGWEVLSWKERIRL